MLGILYSGFDSFIELQPCKLCLQNMMFNKAQTQWENSTLVRALRN